VISSQPSADTPEHTRAQYFLIPAGSLLGDPSPYVFRKAEQHLFVILIHYYPAFCIHRLETFASPWSLPLGRLVRRGVTFIRWWLAVVLFSNKIPIH
jgi:hypothetical protein